ncbi:MAG: hypothetical protein U0992_17385 [Planctomycetaceae bacterium]
MAGLVAGGEPLAIGRTGGGVEHRGIVVGGEDGVIGEGLDEVAAGGVPGLHLHVVGDADDASGVRRGEHTADPAVVGFDVADELVVGGGPPDESAVVAAGDEVVTGECEAGDVAAVAVAAAGDALRLFFGDVEFVDVEVGAADKEAFCGRDAGDGEEDVFGFPFGDAVEMVGVGHGCCHTDLLTTLRIWHRESVLHGMHQVSHRS